MTIAEASTNVRTCCPAPNVTASVCPDVVRWEMEEIVPAVEAGVVMEVVVEAVEAVEGEVVAAEGVAAAGANSGIKNLNVNPLTMRRRAGTFFFT
ncbi:hypothetical protein DPMN_064485 [Dreissena polymorpha]|uniref:Uncharacterized protein n=1 Tax=Dreissena polymorpha TaxID=45954 RepID=A0A9D4CCB3_DREPO|nr:hypothetical protein DPMN_064485 [Dreissena polymorpha]